MPSHKDMAKFMGVLVGFEYKGWSQKCAGKVWSYYSVNEPHSCMSYNIFLTLGFPMSVELGYRKT